MKTKMIFAIAALLMLGSVCLNAQENSNGSTPNDYSKQYFTIVPVDGDITISWMGYHINSTSSFELHWSKDNGETWSGTKADWHSQNVKQGEKVMFYASAFDQIGSIYSVTGRFNVEGNIMSLVYGKDFLNPNTEWFLVQDFSHNGGFLSNQDNLISAENLVIPAVETDNYRIILSNMFKGCTSLTKAPLLLAVTLTKGCYQEMFSGCTSLKYIKCLATDISATDCTKNWLDGVSSSGTFVKASSMNNWPSGASGIPSGWTVTNASPKQTKRTIHVATAGTLPNLISKDDKYEIEELTLTGELNGTDFKFIREMAGDEVSYKKSFWAEVYHNPTDGILTSLDISNAKIVKGGENYNYYISFYDVVGLSTIDDKITVGLFSQTNLKSIILPNTVTSIDEGISYSYMVSTGGTLGANGDDLEIGSIYVFPTCLTSITIPSSVTSIGYGVLSGTAWYYNQPNGLVYAGKVAYNYKGEMPVNSSITIMDGTLGIAGGAFSGCSGMSSVTIPNTVTNVGGNAFYGCNSLTKVVSKIKNPFKIDASVFPSDIYSNAELVVPAGTKSLYEATEGWDKFSKITESPAVKRTIHVATAGTLPNLISKDEKYEIEELTLTGELNGTDFKFIREMAGDVVSSKNVPTKINKYPNLIVCHNPTDGILTSLDISNTEIVEGGENYNYIRDMNHGISGLSTIDNKITPGLFSQTNLKSIILPNSITSIEGKQYGYMYFTDEPGDYEQYEEKYISAFPQSLTSIIIPNSVTSIDNGVFYGTVWYNNQPDGLVYAGKIAYKYKGEMPANTQITIKDGTLGIAGSAFYNCSGLTSITIPNSVTSIGNSAFSGCSDLTSIMIPNSVTSIGNSAFSGCSGLTSITIPNSVTSIGNSAFSGCSGLTSITIPNSVTSIGTYAFSGTIWYNNQPDGLVYAGKIAYKYKGKMPANTSVIIKDGTLGITGEAFSGCSGLTSITIPNSMTSIGSFAFYECSGLTSITIPNSVTSIERGAFSYCSGLTKVVSKIKNPFIIPYVFSSDIFSNAELIVPAGTKSLYEATEDWNKFSKITEHLPTLETQPAQPTSTTKARLIALANEEDDDQHFGFEWLRNDAPANMPANKVSAPLYDGRIIGSLGGLNPDIYYKYRPFYKSDAGEMVYGEWVPFLTGDANVFFEPEVHTKDAVVSNDGALLSAVFVEGTEDIQEKGFEYWQKNSNARAVSLTSENNIGSVIVSGNNTSVTIEGLKAGTEYGYRPYVKTASGITYGEEKTFKTSMFGDVNGDNKVDNNDLNDLVSYIMGIIPPHFNKDVADLNNDNKVNAADIVKMVNILK